uniref:Uncharacterized protein n=1 Tax=Anguilla anguilla TaxID=7936 RepID=A0A0E9WC53_ANGAN
MNNASLSGSLMDESGFGGMHSANCIGPNSANCKVWWKRNNGLGMFFIVWARFHSSSEGKSTSITWQDWMNKCCIWPIFRHFNELNISQKTRNKQIPALRKG